VPTWVAGEQESLRHRGGKADRASEQHHVTGVDPEAVISHRDVLTTAGESLGRHRRRRLVGDVIAAVAPPGASFEDVVIIDVIVIIIIIIIIIIVVIVVCSGRGVGIGRMPMLLTVVQQKEKRRLRCITRQMRMRWRTVQAGSSFSSLKRFWTLEFCLSCSFFLFSRARYTIV